MLCISHNGRKMYILRSVPAECVIKQVIFRCWWKILASPYNMGYVHCVVIYNICKVICWESVWLYEYLVIKLIVINSYGSVNNIVKRRCSFSWHKLTYNKRFSIFQVCLYLFFWKVKTVSVIARKSVSVLVAFFKCVKSFFSTEAVVRFSLFHKFQCVLHIHSHSFALNIRTVFAAYIRTFIMFKTCHFQCFIYYVYRIFNLSFLVGIFYTQNKFSALWFCNKIFI